MGINTLKMNNVHRWCFKLEQLTIFDDQEVYPPRLQAFLDYKNKKHKSEIKIGEFMDWIGYHLETFRKTNKIMKYQPFTKEQQDQFTAYLFDVSEG